MPYSREPAGQYPTDDRPEALGATRSAEVFYPICVCPTSELPPTPQKSEDCRAPVSNTFLFYITNVV